ncbi:geranyl transferase [Pseudomonas sp. FW300-N1A1]|nr:geranyl transferase [Pseudomonas sp. FW300-N1A1]
MTSAEPLSAIAQPCSDEVFDAWKRDVVQRTEQVLERALPASNITPARLHEAMRFAVLGGGKRTRPLLCHAAGIAVGADTQALTVVAAALEMMHVYSLVHDDLPAMDNDDLRRGQPTVHVKYDEATAILVGDALQAQAFITLRDSSIPTDCQARLMGELATAVGSCGMAGGQMIDLASVGIELNRTQLEQMHRMKTGALIQASVRMGALCAENASFDLQALDRYSARIGLAFQVVDDILDATMDTATLGKTAGKDARDHKPTYVSIMGLHPARQLAQQLVAQAHQSLEPVGAAATWLHGLADLIIKRVR